MTERPSQTPPFTLCGVTWHCLVISDGDFSWYEWRSACGHFAVWRDDGWCARRGDVVGRHKHHRLIEAMWAAQKEHVREVAA